MTLRLSGPVVVSFSGLDGAGKSTQIAALRRAVGQLGMRCRLVTFWDDVVVGSRWRESFVHRVYGSERGVGEPGKPVNRRDKNMRAWYLTAIRLLLYFADAVHLRWVLFRQRRKGDVILADRYIFDELANLPLDNRICAGFVRLLAWVAPRPELALLLDAEPEMARARKPEYPLEFLFESRQRYLHLARLLHLQRIPPLPLEETERAVLTCFLRILGRRSEQGSNRAAA